MANITPTPTILTPQDVTNNGGVAPASPADVPELTPEQRAAMTPEEKDRWWFRNVYQGDKMPQLTLRAVLMGGILGMLMSASNLYTTLTIGWAFGVAITACVMSYVFWNILRAVTGVSQMSILENNCMQSTASAAGYSTGSTIATMFGALLLLQTGDSAKIRTFDVQPIWLVAIFTLCTGLMGVLLAIPMKRQMINHEQLPFPSGIASAETLRSLYSQSKEAVHKAYSLVISLAAGAIIGVFNTDEDTASKIPPLAKSFAWFKDKFFNIQLKALYPESGILKCDAGRLTGFGFAKNDTGDIVWKTSLASTPGKAMIDFGFQPSVLLIGAGMITGLRVSLSMLAGSALLYFFVAPQMIGLDAAHAGEAGYKPSIEIIAGGTVFHVYRWALWGGTGLMVFSSLTSLAMQWKTIGRAFTKSREEASHGEKLDDAAMKGLEVPGWWMIAGMVPVAIAMLILQIVAFHISWYAGLIAIALSFVLSLVACRATGETDTTPIGAMGKVMQLTFALLHPGQIVPNLASAGIAANSASSSADLLTDLKSGYLLGANPRKQFLAQFFGVFFGTVAIVPIWYLMVPTKAVMEKFPAPGTQSWYRIAKVLTEGLSSLPDTAKIALLGGCFVGILLPLIEKFVVPAKYRKFWPSAMGLGLSWVVPFASAFSFAIGAVISFIWSRVHKKSESVFNVPIASGLIAGESLMKALIAMTATAIGLISGG
jgi:OPT family oligopeptide transporter